jgi:hypothetical protein
MKEKNNVGSSVGLKDNCDLSLKGMFRVFEVTPDGERKELLYENNLVVMRARQILRDLIYDGNNDYIISKMKFGNKGHVGNDYLTPNPPKLTDTNLYGDVTYTKSVGRSKKDLNKIVYTCRLNQNEANLSGGTFPITEAGLFNSRDELFARKTFPVITKTGDRIYDFEWTIIF